MVMVVSLFFLWKAFLKLSQPVVTIVRSCGGVVNNASPVCLLTGSPGLLESHLSPALGNVRVLFKEPRAPSQCDTAFFWPSSLENRPSLELCFGRCAGAVSSMLVQFYSQQFGQRRRGGNGERYVQNFSRLSGLLQQRPQDHLSPDLSVTAEAHVRTGDCNTNRAASGAVGRSELKQPSERLFAASPETTFKVATRRLSCCLLCSLHAHQEPAMGQQFLDFMPLSEKQRG